MQSLYRKRVTLAGEAMLTEVGPDNQAGKNRNREKRENPTPEAVARYNQQMAIKKLRLLIDANFGVGDFHATLTYAGEAPSKEEAKKALNNFLKKARRLSRKKGEEMKYILSTELGEGKRIHHHIIMSGLSSHEVMELWKPYGNPAFRYLDGSGDYKNLAVYLLKESRANLRSGLITKRWSGSRNLKQPVVKEKTVKRWNRLDKTPKEYKNYALMDWETVVNPVTGAVSQYAYYLRINRPSSRFGRKKE